MTTNPSLSPRSVADAASLVARWVLGAVFLWMGLNKALHPVEFLKLARQYELVQHFLLLNSIAVALPWFEAFCGLLLLAGIAVRGTALILVLMLVPFSYIVFQRALAVHTAAGIPFCVVHFDCGCGTGEVFICRKLLENAALLLLSTCLLTGRGQRCSLRYRLV
jgi:uncharacterized membrane protein YphA (DoxX/SURF4 family)